MRKHGSGVLLGALLLVACASDDGRNEAGPPATLAPAATETETTVTTGTTGTAAPSPAPAEDRAERTLTVGGRGSAQAPPVRCTIDIGVSSTRPTVEEAARAASAAAEAMTAALTAAGVAPEDMQTTQFDITAVYAPYSYGPTQEISGYQTNIGYRVTMRDTSAVGPALARAIEAGGENARAYGLSFEADAASLMDEARAEAWADAEGRARALADLMGVPLGGVTDIHEKLYVTTNQGMAAGGEGDSASFEVPVSPGVAGVTLLLTVSYAIG